jgi:hypothetical protein
MMKVKIRVMVLEKAKRDTFERYVQVELTRMWLLNASKAIEVDRRYYKTTSSKWHSREMA